MQDKLYWFRSRTENAELQPIVVIAPNLNVAIARYRSVYDYQYAYKIEEDPSNPCVLTERNIDLRKKEHSD